MQLGKSQGKCRVGRVRYYCILLFDCFLGIWTQVLRFVQQTLDKLNHLPRSLSCGTPLLSKWWSHRVLDAPTLRCGLWSSNPTGLPRTSPHTSHLIRSLWLCTLERCLQEPSDLEQILLLLISNNESPCRVLVQDPGQVSNSKLNPSPVNIYCSTSCHLKRFSFSHLQNRQRTPPSTDMSIFLPHWVVILLEAESHVSYHNRN